MLKKSLGFGLLAAGLIFAPGAALADIQVQESDQTTIQRGSAAHGSTNAQSNESINIQEQIQKTRDRVRGNYGSYGRRYPRPYCVGGVNGQAQKSSQGTVQAGDAFDGSVNAQSNSGINDQKQVASNSKVCR